MTALEQPYIDLLRKIYLYGNIKDDRTGVGTRSLFGEQLRFDLSRGFPLLTTKRMHLRSIIHELLWFLRGDTNIAYLREHGVRIWDEWADATGEIGPIYGKQWRAWQGARGEAIDQIGNVVERIKINPDCRRLIVSAWNVEDVPRMRLACCHCLFQFYVADKRLSCHMYQRSADMFLGVPFNIASYALLTMMVANVTGYGYGDLVISFGDAHIYRNHLAQVAEQIERKPYEAPIMRVTRHDSIDAFRFDDFSLIDYQHHPAISAPVAV